MSGVRRSPARLGWAALGALLVVGSSGCGAPQERPLRVMGATPAADRVVVVRYGIGRCEEFRGVTASESPSRVAITVRGVRTGDTCSAVELVRTTRVTLAQPLGTRPVVDGGSGRTVPRGS